MTTSHPEDRKALDKLDKNEILISFISPFCLFQWFPRTAGWGAQCAAGEEGHGPGCRRDGPGPQEPELIKTPVSCWWSQSHSGCNGGVG